MRNDMLNLTPHHRLHVPNGLAILAAVLLLVSSFVGNNTNQEAYSSGADSTAAMKMENTDGNRVNDSAEHKSRGLNLGSLLFRRG